MYDSQSVRRLSNSGQSNFLRCSKFGTTQASTLMDIKTLCIDDVKKVSVMLNNYFVAVTNVHNSVLNYSSIVFPSAVTIFSLSQSCSGGTGSTG